MSVKSCSRCEKERPVTEFTADRRASDGLQSACKKCCRESTRRRRMENYDEVRARERRYFEENKERIYEINKASRARNSEKVRQRKKEYYERVKHDPEFQRRLREYTIRNRERKRRYDKEYCAKHMKKKTEYSKRWRHENPDRRKAIVKAYDARRRAKTEGGASGKEVHNWIQGQRKECYWCGDPCGSDFHVDHYIPLAKGGEHELYNLVIACPPCNTKKNAKMPEDFLAEQGRLA